MKESEYRLATEIWTVGEARDRYQIDADSFAWNVDAETAIQFNRDNPAVRYTVAAFKEVQ